VSQKSSHLLTVCNFVKCQVNDFQNFCTARKRTKFATKLIRHYPPHLRHVATLPVEIKNSDFLQMLKKTQTNCILIASNFVIHPQILTFSVFKIATLKSRVMFYKQGVDFRRLEKNNPIKRTRLCWIALLVT